MNAQQLVEKWHAEFLVSDAPDHWGYEISWTTADEIARRIDEANEASAPEPESCLLSGDPTIDDSYCTLQAGHTGPCSLVAL